MAHRAESMARKREFLGNYNIARGKVGKVYWVDDPHQPVEIDIVRIKDGAVLITLHKAVADICIYEVIGILEKAGKWNP